MRCVILCSGCRALHHQGFDWTSRQIYRPFGASAEEFYSGYELLIAVLHRNCLCIFAYSWLWLVITFVLMIHTLHVRTCGILIVFWHKCVYVGGFLRQMCVCMYVYVCMRVHMTELDAWFAIYSGDTSWQLLPTHVTRYIRSCVLACVDAP